MNEIERSWKSADKIEPIDSELPVRQVYVWVSTQDECIAIVSKDGEKWQLPGGKPEPGETLKETAVREVYEETGINLAP